METSFFFMYICLNSLKYFNCELNLHIFLEAEANHKDRNVPKTNEFQFILNLLAEDHPEIYSVHSLESQ